MKNKLCNFFIGGCIVMGLACASSSQGTENQYIEGKHYVNPALTIKRKGEPIESIGDCKAQHPPYSTFKVPLAIMGFDCGFLKTKDLPVIPYKEEYFEDKYKENFEGWYTPELGNKLNWMMDQTPASFMKNSVLWVSPQITQNLGKKKFQEYIVKLNYGNKDISGNPGKDDGLLRSWLGTSLKISVEEQVEFLEKLLKNELDVSSKAQEITREIMDREESWDGWKLYGKTGGGKEGWFIGWIEKDGQHIIFAQYLEKLDLTIQTTVGLMAKDVAKEKLRGYLS